MKICENCKKEHDGNYGSGRFCSCKCARGFSTKSKRKEINKKVSKKLKGKIYKIYNNNCLNCNKLCKNKFCCINCYKEYYNNIRTSFENYKIKCKFEFNIYDYPNMFDLSLIYKYGWYSASNKQNNLNGISRDHIFSIKEAFINNIDPKLISHPANCKLIRHKDNQRKNIKSEITLEKLILKIKKFDDDVAKRFNANGCNPFIL